MDRTSSTYASSCVTSSQVAELFSGLVPSAPIWFDSLSGVVSVNTQARRLGCLIFLIGTIAQGRKLQSLLFSLPGEELAALKANLAGNGFTSGYLTQKASSIAHYLDAAVELQLLVKQGSMFSLTNRARFLMDGVRPTWASPYPLGPETRIFLLHALLGVDYFGLAAVVNSLLRGKGKLIQVQKEHQSQLLRVLEAATRGSSDSRLHRLAQDRIIGIRNWKQPDSYSEHLVSAKLNWLVDLGIAKCAARSSSEFILEEKHEQWLRCFCQTIVPTEADIAAHALNYAKIIAPETTQEREANPCSILGYAFSHLAYPGPLVKLRSVDVVLCFLCFFAPFLFRRIRSAVPLFPQVTILCGAKTYKITIASRSTQSFVVCSKGKDE